jgi:hypothetical protein
VCPVCGDPSTIGLCLTCRAKQLCPSCEQPTSYPGDLCDACLLQTRATQCLGDPSCRRSVIDRSLPFCTEHYGIKQTDDLFGEMLAENDTQQGARAIPEGMCQTCGLEPILCKGRCGTCDRYYRRNGRERPERSWRRHDALMEARIARRWTRVSRSGLSKCENDHLMTPQNTRVRPDGTLSCRACDRERKRKERD